jgi:hypothetical protein
MPPSLHPPPQQQNPSFKIPEQLPIEFLREWAMLATVEDDAMLMGTTLKHAASNGSCLLDVLGDVPVLSTLTDEVSRMAKRSVPRETSVLHLLSGVENLPPSLTELLGREGDPCVYLEAVYNGRTTVSTTDMFDCLIIPRSTLARDIQLSKASPVHLFRAVPNAHLITSFVHSKSTQEIEAMKVRLWKRISAEPGPAFGGKCTRSAQSALRVCVWRCSENAWVETEVQVMLEVSQWHLGQVSHFALSFHVDTSSPNSRAAMFTRSVIKSTAEVPDSIFSPAPLTAALLATTYERSFHVDTTSNNARATMFTSRDQVTQSIDESDGDITMPTVDLSVYVPPATAPVVALNASMASQETAASFSMEDVRVLSATLSTETLESPKETLLMTAIYDCVGEKEDELSFKAGDVIEVRRVGEADGWWAGCLFDKPERPGFFPSSYAISTHVDHASTSAEEHQSGLAGQCSSYTDVSGLNP